MKIKDLHWSLQIAAKEEFEKQSYQLPKGFEYKIHNYCHPKGVLTSHHLDFNSFDEKIYKWESNGFHLFELRSKSINIMAYCIIVKSK